MRGTSTSKKTVAFAASLALALSVVAAPVAIQPQQAFAKAPKAVKIKSGSFRFSGGGDYIRTLKLSWSKVSGAKGYQVKMKKFYGGRGGGYEGWETLGSTTKTSYKKRWEGAKFLVGGKFKVRAYKLTKSGKRTWGKWSAVKTLKAQGW